MCELFNYVVALASQDMAVVLALKIAKIKTSEAETKWEDQSARAPEPGGHVLDHEQTGAPRPAIKSSTKDNKYQRLCRRSISFRTQTESF